MNVALSLLLSLTAPTVLADSVKLGVDQTALQFVTGAELSEAGVPLGTVDPAGIGLRCGSDTVALRVTGLEDGRLSPTSRLIFYGTALDTRFTDTNVYWLSFDGQHVVRMEELQPPVAGGEPARSFTASLRLERNDTYAYLMGDPTKGDLRPWFWGIFKPGGPLEVGLDLPNLADPQAPAVLRARLRARTADPATDPDHHVVVGLNGVQTAELRFDGPEWMVLEQPIPPGTLAKEQNTLVFSCPGDTGSEIPEQVYLDWIEIEYQHDLVAGKEGLEVFAPGGKRQSVEITGLTAETVDWYDLSAPLRPTVAPGVPVADGRVALGLGETGTHYAAVTPDGYVSAASVEARPAPYLKAAESGADYLIIAHEDLLDAIQPLAEYRQGQGLRVEVVPVHQVYDEFGDGVFTPYAIRDFVAYALAAWKPPPQYLLLVGDATYDYRDYRGTGFESLVPTIMAREAGSIEVAADAAFAVDADTGTVRLAVGRFPADTPEQVAKLVETTMAFEKLGAARADSRKMLFVADQEGFGPLAHRFDRVCDLWADTAARAGFVVEKFYQTQVGLTEDQDRDARVARTRERLTPGLVESLRDGPYGIFYMGHGDEYFWAYNKLLMVEDLEGLESPAPGICIQDTCFAGGFDLPGGQLSISEALLWSGVCAASYAPSRLGGNDVQGDLIRRLIDGSLGRLGQAVLKTRQKRRLRVGDDSWASGSNFNLLGDPALVVTAAGADGAQ